MRDQVESTQSAETVSLFRRELLFARSLTCATVSESIRNGGATKQTMEVRNASRSVLQANARRRVSIRTKRKWGQAYGST